MRRPQAELEHEDGCLPEGPFNLVPPEKRQAGDARAKGVEVPKPARDWITRECERGCRETRNSMRIARTNPDERKSPARHNGLQVEIFNTARFFPSRDSNSGK